MSLERILLVDDNEGQRITLESILKRSGFKVSTADCGKAALAAAQEDQFAAALLDIKMPDLTGIEVLKSLKEQQPDVMVIMMTGYSEADYAINALNAGASAFLIKPANIEQIKMLLSQALDHHRLIEENRTMSTALREWNTELEKKVAERTEQLSKAHKTALNFYAELKKNFESTLEVLSIAIDQRDALTSSHSFRVTQYAVTIGKIMNLPDDDIEKLRYSGLMHDLGKIEVRPEILCKEGSLTTEEYKEIQTHAQGTFQLLSKFKFKRNLADVPLIASSHHERFDGAGYPRKLTGEKIPLLARILAVADVLDAITSKRHYRTAMAITDALNIMKRESGAHFDPVVIDRLFEMSTSEFMKIHLAEFLDQLEPADLVDLEPFTLSDLLEAGRATKPDEKQTKLMQMVYKYFQGPVPITWEGKLAPAPKFHEEIPE